ncbi:hypothetical protein ACHAXS_007618, partial [Conticribra weissflogii]
SPTLSPTLSPTIDPTVTPTLTPTLNPTMAPTIDPTVDPTLAPTLNPTLSPTIGPTLNPTLNPTINPTLDPTVDPTLNPTMTPTSDPTIAPTMYPTMAPTFTPTSDPTLVPTRKPTNKPTNEPTNEPSKAPTKKPTAIPTETPSRAPTRAPTAAPITSAPSKAPTNKPSGLLPITREPSRSSATMVPSAGDTSIGEVPTTERPTTSINQAPPSDSTPDIGALCTVPRRTCFRRAEDPSSNVLCDDIVCNDPYVGDNERLLEGIFYMTLLQDSTAVTSSNEIEMERAILNFLADNIGSGDTFEPVCAFITDNAYDMQQVLDGTGKFVESTSLEIQMSFVESEGARRRLDIGFDQNTRNLQQCTGIDRALCCSQYAINGNVGDYCSTLGCTLDQCGQGRRQANRKLETAVPKAQRRNAKSGKSSKSSKAGLFDVWWSSKSSKDTPVSKPLPQRPPQTPPTPSSNPSTLPNGCAAYGFLKDSFFNTVVRRYTSFKPIQTRLILDASSIDSVAACSVNRFALDYIGTPTMLCSEFITDDCENNEDVLPVPDPTRDCELVFQAPPAPPTQLAPPAPPSTPTQLAPPVTPVAQVSPVPRPASLPMPSTPKPAAPSVPKRSPVFGKSGKSSKTSKTLRVTPRSQPVKLAFGMSHMEPKTETLIVESTPRADANTISKLFMSTLWAMWLVVTLSTRFLF